MHVCGTVAADVPHTLHSRRASAPPIAAKLLACGLALTPISALSLDFTAGSGAAHECSSGRPRLSAAAVAYLQPAPLSTIDDYGGTRYAPDNGRNIGIGVGFAELSVGLGAYCLGALYRTEFEGRGSRDLLDVLHGNRNGVTFESGRTYSLDYEAEALRATGLRLRRVFRLGQIGSLDFQLGVGLSMLKAIGARWESMAGSVTASSAEYATGTATWVRTGTEISSFNPFVDGGDPQGLGYSTDLHLQATFASGTQFDVIAMDLYGRVHWHNARDSMRVLDNAAFRYDANANREAFVHGLDRRVDTVQKIPTKYRLAVSRPVFGAWSILAADDLVRGSQFPSIGAQYGTPEHSIAANFDFRTHAVGIGARWGILTASLTSDRLKWRDASTLGLSLGIAARW